MNDILRGLAAELIPGWVQAANGQPDEPAPEALKNGDEKKNPQPGVDPDDINEASTPGAGVLPEGEPSVEPGTG